RVDNHELARDLGCSAADIESLSGVESRYYAADGEGPSDLAKRAAESTFREAQVSAADVEFVIFATMTPDVTFPGSGCYLQDKLGCGTIGALDVRAQCAGFLFALDIAMQFLKAGRYRRILLAAGDVHSSGLDFSPRGAAVTPLFGDGAAAVILGEEGENIVESVIHTDSSHFERFWCEFPSSRRLPTRFLSDDLERAKHYPTIDADAVKRDGLGQIEAAVNEVLDKSGTRPEHVRRYFLQHVFREVAAAAADSLGVRDRCTIGGRDEGHVASASLPIALDRARGSGEVKAGDLVCLATAGSGANSGAALVRL
ncbi:MAG: 3-oxoacyl-ACP synthase III family protein, partial [Candidatus Binatia bacterium]